MRIGIGLPAAIPGAPGTAVGDWAAAAEGRGFRSVGVIDRLVYDNLDPLVALAAAAARTTRVELLTTVLNVAYRRNAVVLAKQLASLDAVAGGRLTAGLAIGGWPADHAVVGPSSRPVGALMDEMVATMLDAWGSRRPRLLVGGLVPASFNRAARVGDGWVAPSFGFEQLQTGIAGVAAAWRDAGRVDRPRIVVERYFCLGPDAEETAAHYLDHYYGALYVDAVMADTLTTEPHLHAELARLHDVGCDDVVLLPCDADVGQLHRLADALSLDARMAG